MTAAIYIRTATAGERPQHPLQEARSRDFADLHALDVTEVYTDVGVSGQTPLAQRPAGARLMSDAAAGAFQTVIVTDRERIGRDARRVLDDIVGLERLGVRVEIVCDAQRRMTTLTSAAIYVRVSTEEQGKGYSLPTQIESCHRHAADRGYRVVGVFSDEHSGTELDRPGLAALYEALPRDRPELLILHDIDRLGRTVAVQAIIERELERAGVRIEYVLGGYQDTPEGELLKLIKGSIAQYENRQRVERSRRGKNGRVLSGSVIPTAGRAPFGYDYVSAPHRGEFVINEGQAAIVRDMYRWLTVERLSSYAIARRLHEMMVPSQGDILPSMVKKTGRGEWSPATVRRILRNPVYRGEWRWGTTRHTKRNGKRIQTPTPEDTWITVQVPALVDADTWERAQGCLTENKANAKRNTKREYLLRGMVFCVCGRRWTGRYKNHLDRAYYRCPTSEAEGWRKACPVRWSFRQELLEVAVWRKVIDYLMHPDTMTVELERQRAETAEAAGRRAERLAAVDAALRDVDRKLEALLVQALEGYPQAIIDRQKRALLSQRTDLEGERDRIEDEQGRSDITPETIATLHELAAMVREAVPALTDAERRKMLEMLRLRVDVLDEKRVRVTGLITEAIVDLSCSSLP